MNHYPDHWVQIQSELWDYFTINGQVSDNFLSFYMNLFTDGIIINFSEMKKKKWNEREKKQTHIFDSWRPPWSSSVIQFSQFIHSLYQFRFDCSMFPLAFVAGWLQGHWWGFISRNYVVWPTSLLMNVFIALKGSHFWFLLTIHCPGC